MTNLLKVWGWRDRLYRIHVVTGLAAAVWFFLLAVTGVLINHQESLGLLDAEISNRYLPGSYRADAPTDATRLNILITDLHSGQIFGSQGHWVSDLAALFLTVSLLTGFVSHRLKRRLQASNHREAARVPAPLRPADSRWSPPASLPVPDGSAVLREAASRTGLPAH